VSKFRGAVHISFFIPQVSKEYQIIAKKVRDKIKLEESLINELQVK